MTESEFLALAERTLAAIERALEQAADEVDVDIECARNGNVLTIEFIDNGSKLIVNSQEAMQQIWVAARSGGFHYRYAGDQWRNTRDDTELFASLSQMASDQAGVVLTLTSSDSR